MVPAININQMGYCVKSRTCRMFSTY